PHRPPRLLPGRIQPPVADVYPRVRTSGPELDPEIVRTLAQLAGWIRQRDREVARPHGLQHGTCRRLLYRDRGALPDSPGADEAKRGDDEHDDHPRRPLLPRRRLGDHTTGRLTCRDETEPPFLHPVEEHRRD